MISGIKITPLKQIVDDRGKIMHMLRSDSSIFTNFGEIYFSTIYKNVFHYCGLYCLTYGGWNQYCI